MTDREMLELAAKAAGIEIIRNRLDDPLCGDMLINGSSRNAHHEKGPWNPLADDGDAFRLAVKLGLDIDRVSNGYVTVRPMDSDHGRDLLISICLSIEKDPYAATRRAIVRAAAEIGKRMK